MVSNLKSEFDAEVGSFKLNLVLKSKFDFEVDFDFELKLILKSKLVLVLKFEVGSGFEVEADGGYPSWNFEGGACKVEHLPIQLSGGR